MRTSYQIVLLGIAIAAVIYLSGCTVQYAQGVSASDQQRHQDCMNNCGFICSCPLPDPSPLQPFP